MKITPSPLVHIRCLTLALLMACGWCLSVPAAEDAATEAELKNLTINGGMEDGKARLVIEALLNHIPSGKSRSIYATALQHTIHLSADKLEHHMDLVLDVLDGEPTEFPMTIAGDGQIQQVTGAALLDWSVRQGTNGTRTLVLRPRKVQPALTQLAVTVLATQPVKPSTVKVVPLTLTPLHPALFNGYVKVEADPDVDVRARETTGLVPIEPRFLPEALRAAQPTAVSAELLAFRFQGSAYELPLEMGPADPETRQVVLHDFKLVGQMSDQTASFELTATARVKNPKGGSLDLLTGAVGLTTVEAVPGWDIRFEHESFVMRFEKAGDYPVRLKFNSVVRQMEGWNRVDFRVAPSVLQEIDLQGLPADTRFEFNGAARPERRGSEFVSYLPANGAVSLKWKEARAEAEGKLFYAAEMLSHVSVGPGLMSQTALLDFKVMQGELNRVVLLLRGAGEVTRVQGDAVLAWKLVPAPNGTGRRLEVQLNQPQQDRFSLQVQMQTPLGAFPQTVDAAQLRPEGATRFAGYCRVVNDGAVRLEITQATGLSQISPDQFPESAATKAAFRFSGGQRFAYRFSGAEFGLRIQADQIQPELAVSEVLLYHLGENELAIEAELELDIREAPLRELLLRVPKSYGLARLNVAGLSDYFLTEPPAQPDAELRLVYSQPVAGRQIVQLRLERNQALGATNWTLPRVEVSKTKSVRGQLGVSAEPGYRLSPERTDSLTEIATAFFPRKVQGLQSAYRLSEAGWQATFRIERLPQTVQADVLHLFSIGEGIAYGSSVINYLVSGAPVSAFRVDLSPEYSNVEFTGKDIRNWEKGTNGYLVQLHTPVSGAYTLLATYERPFKAQGETLTFSGARPLDAQAEQGYTLVVSAYQFQVQPVEVSPGLLPLEAGEVPTEYRLFFDAPILGAYRYTSRPFNLRLALSPLAQGDSLSQVVDRASLRTRISKAGQVLTDVRYFVKNRGHPHFRLTLPEGTQLWSATVNGAAVVPVTDANENLIPLPQRADPNSVLTVDLKLASRSSSATRVSVAAPSVGAPVMLADWSIAPDTGQRLTYRGGSLKPAQGDPDLSGFGELVRMFTGGEAWRATSLLLSALGLVGIALMVWRYTARPEVFRFSARFVLGTTLGLISFLLTLVALVSLGQLGDHPNPSAPSALTFVAPVQQAHSSWVVAVANVEDRLSVWTGIERSWPALLGLMIWGYTLLQRRDSTPPLGWLAGWLLLGWAALRWPNGAPSFFLVIAGFLACCLLIPALRHLWRLPLRRTSNALSGAGPAPAAALILIGGFLWLSYGVSQVRAADGKPAPVSTERGDGRPELGRLFVGPAALAKPPAVAELIRQEIRVEEKVAIGSARIRWSARKGELLPLLFESAVLTRVSYPTNLAKLVPSVPGQRPGSYLLTLNDGLVDIEVTYQVKVEKRENESGFTLPTGRSLMNQVQITLSNLDVDVVSPEAVSVHREFRDTQTSARLVLSPLEGAWIGWKPRSRDVKGEKAIFYAELQQLYVPSAGVVEGLHLAALRPAQGELSELLFNVPSGMSITDVLDASRWGVGSGPTNAASVLPAVALWRFDPDTRKLRVNLRQPQSRPFSIVIRSQLSTGPMPIGQIVGLLSVEGAASDIGLLGLATGKEVQLDTVTTDRLSAINIEDFPASFLQAAEAQTPGLTLRRAFRYVEPTATATLQASAVEPDVRVETQDTLSLGEDRTVLAVTLGVNITRAGIFRLSFTLPTGLDVEAISGESLSHWTDLKTETGRIVTLHLKGKTEGQQQFTVSLSGPGIKTAKAWVAPQLLLREASKQRGTLLVVPEQGMRLQVVARDGLTQLDPQKSGVRQKGVLAFRVLQTPYRLTMDIEQVDAWIQVTSLQHATLTEALTKVAANLQYQIENTGLKSFRLLLPTNSESVRFQGDQVADFRPIAGAQTNALQQWEVKLHRRVMGPYLLQVSYQTRIPEQATNTTLTGLQALDVNLQRGFVTVQAGGRLQVRIEAPPTALQPTEWQSIPRALQQDLSTASANYAFRLVDPSFQLPLQLDRHPAAKLLAARVNSITLKSVIADDGAMLTQVQLDMVPGDKRLLYLTLPADAKFWFAFVNQNGVWPWREQDRILIPLEQQSHGAEAIPVEIFYSSQIGKGGGRALDLELLAPKFDLPLENITWRVYLNEKWQVKHWAGSLQLEERQLALQPPEASLQSYLKNEASAQREKTKEAEQMLATGNTALQRGDPEQARRAFQAAFGLSQGDDAFNEDARVQLNNLKLQQALVGLNVRQAVVAGESEALAGKLRDLRARKNATYTQEDAKAIIDRNTGEENAALARLAQRLIQQQDAAVTTPAAIRASIPEQGQVLTFKRAVLVDLWGDLRVQLHATSTLASSWVLRACILLCTCVVLALVAWGARPLRRTA